MNHKNLYNFHEYPYNLNAKRDICNKEKHNYYSHGTKCNERKKNEIET